MKEAIEKQLSDAENRVSVNDAPDVVFALSIHSAAYKKFQPSFLSDLNALSLAAYEAGRADGLRLLEGRGSSWIRTDGRWSVSGFEGTSEEGMIEYLELLKTNSEHDILENID